MQRRGVNPAGIRIRLLGLRISALQVIEPASPFRSHEGISAGLLKSRDFLEGLIIFLTRLGLDGRGQRTRDGVIGWRAVRGLLLDPERSRRIPNHGGRLRQRAAEELLARQRQNRSGDECHKETCHGLKWLAPRERG
jgi:hypothetical protein